MFGRSLAIEVRKGRPDFYIMRASYDSVQGGTFDIMEIGVPLLHIIWEKQTWNNNKEADPQGAEGDRHHTGGTMSSWRCGWILGKLWMFTWRFAIVIAVLALIVRLK